MVVVHALPALVPSLPAAAAAQPPPHPRLPAPPRARLLPRLLLHPHPSWLARWAGSWGWPSPTGATSVARWTLFNSSDPPPLPQWWAMYSHLGLPHKLRHSPVAPVALCPCAALEESGSAASSTVGRSIMPLTFHHAKQLVWQAGRHPAAFCCGMGLATTEDAADGRAREGTHQTSGGGVVGSRAKRGKRCSVGERRHTDTGGKKVELSLGVAQHAQQRRRTHLVSHPLSVTSSAPPTRGPVRLMPGVRQQSQLLPSQCQEEMLLPSQAASHRQVLLPSAAKQPPLTGAAAPHSCCSTLGVTCPHAKQEDGTAQLVLGPAQPPAAQPATAAATVPLPG